MSIQTNQTSRRQDWVSFVTRAIVLSLFLLIPCQPVNALDERVVFDPYTGLSLAGYDPVAYFVSGAAVAGLPDYEVVYGVAQPGNPTLFAIHRNRVYLFASEDERRTFLADPEAMIAAAAAHWPDVLKVLAY